MIYSRELKKQVISEMPGAVNAPGISYIYNYS